MILLAYGFLPGIDATPFKFNEIIAVNYAKYQTIKDNGYNLYLDIDRSPAFAHQHGAVKQIGSRIFRPGYVWQVRIDSCIDDLKLLSRTYQPMAQKTCVGIRPVTRKVHAKE